MKLANVPYYVNLNGLPLTEDDVIPLFFLSLANKIYLNKFLENSSFQLQYLGVQFSVESPVIDN